ncbi:caspase family protein [Amycolatopsis sp. NPDC058278]|uniref:caspase family protein n=1 Tax=Amycolatopsis sp. NPDC058278 TaxID=3346417 RepID=UPI0036DE2EDE
MRPDPTEPRRYLVATAVAHYPKAPQWNRPGLIEACKQIVTLFTRELGYQHVSSLAPNPTGDQLTTQLRAFCRDEARRPDDIVAVYLGCHGEVLDDAHEHMLLTADADPDDVDDALPTVELARKMLRGTRIRRVLLMLDTCYSGHGGDEFTAAAITSMTRKWGDTHGSGLAVITSAQSSEQAVTGVFPRLLRDAVGSLTTAGSNPAVLPLDSIVRAMNADSDKPGHQTIGYSVAGLTGEVPPFLPNPRHGTSLTKVDLAIQHASEFEVHEERRDTELRTRLLIRAMGGNSSGTGGWWFAGRHTALLDITAWLHHPDPSRPLLVVTGNPGSGKTAVLGLIASLTHPQRRVTVPVHTLGLPAAAVPALASVDVAIYAQRLTTDQVLAGIATAVRSRADTPGQLLEELVDRDTPLTVLIDALDEAADPDDLTRRLLRPLVDHAAGKIRLLVGTRDFLLDRLGQRRDTAIDLDADRYADLQALTTYATTCLLEASPNSPYRSETPGRLRAVAEAVAAAADPSFLVAGITSATLAARDQTVDPQDSGWCRALPRLPGEAMHRDLETRFDDKAKKVRDLLRPLAFAEGQGLPWEDIWAPVASRAAGITYTDEDLLWLRKHAGSYVVEATEDGRSTYRLYHQALADYLRDGVDAAALHGAIAEVLASRVARKLDGCLDWTRAHPYTLRHLATHAALAGRIDALLADTDYLVHAEPDALLLALHHTTTDTGALTAAVYRCTSHIHRHLPPPRRRQVLAVDAARFRASRLQQDLSASLTWRPRWATGQQAGRTLLTAFTEHANYVMAVACSDIDGHPVAVTADEEAIRVWDLVTGAGTGTELITLSDRIGWVNAMACTHLDGRPVAVTAGADSVARVWDIATGTALTTFTKHTGWVNDVACTHLNGRAVAVTADEEAARVWDLATGTELTTFTGHTGWVRAVACTHLNGHPVAVTTSDDNTARVWDLATGTELTTFTGHTGRVKAVACTRLNDRPIAVTTDDDTARVWDLASGAALTTFTRHTGWIYSVACTHLNARPVAVTVGNDNTARVWDLATGTELTAFTEHIRSVKAVACTDVDGRAVVVTASGNIARVWRLPVESTSWTAATGHSAAVLAGACGVLGGLSVVVTAGEDGTARVWDLTTGTELTTFAKHTGWVNAVAFTHLDGRPVAVTAGRDEFARVWDPATGTELTTMHSGWVNAVACTHLGGRAIAVTTGTDAARVWDLATGTEITELTAYTLYAGSDNAVTCTHLYSRPIAVITNGDAAQVWDLTTGTELTTLAHKSRVRAVACTHLDGRAIAVTTDNDTVARIWDLATGTELTKLTKGVRAVACTHLDDRPIAVTAGYYATRAWDLATGDEVGVFDFQQVGTVATGPSRELILALGWDIIVLHHVAEP